MVYTVLRFHIPVDQAITPVMQMLADRLLDLFTSTVISKVGGRWRMRGVKEKTLLDSEMCNSSSQLLFVCMPFKTSIFNKLGLITANKLPYMWKKLLWTTPVCTQKNRQERMGKKRQSDVTASLMSKVSRYRESRSNNNILKTMTHYCTSLRRTRHPQWGWLHSTHTSNWTGKEVQMNAAPYTNDDESLRETPAWSHQDSRAICIKWRSLVLQDDPNCNKVGDDMVSECP